MSEIKPKASSLSNRSHNISSDLSSSFLQNKQHFHNDVTTRSEDTENKLKIMTQDRPTLFDTIEKARARAASRCFGGHNGGGACRESHNLAWVHICIQICVCFCLMLSRWLVSSHHLNLFYAILWLLLFFFHFFFAFLDTCYDLICKVIIEKGVNNISLLLSAPFHSPFALLFLFF